MSEAKKSARAAKKAAKAEIKALKHAKKVARAEKQLARIEGRASVTKKAAVFGHPVRNLLVAAVIAAALGVLFIVEAALVYTYCCYAVGGIMALFGLVYIIMYFARRPVSGEYHYEFGFGLVAVLAGAYVALSSMLFSGSNMEINFTVIVQLIGIAVALDGIMKLQYALDLARMRHKKWWIVLITSVLGIALGVAMTVFLDYITYYSTSYGLPVMTALGAVYCFNALLDIIALIVVAVRNRKASKKAALAEAEAKIAAASEEEPVEEVVILVEEPVAEEPSAEEAAVILEEPAAEEPAAEEPVMAEPAVAVTTEE